MESRDFQDYICEREDAIVTLRDLCKLFGDNEWKDELQLSDIIEKHLIKPALANGNIKECGELGFRQQIEKLEQSHEYQKAQAEHLSKLVDKKNKEITTLNEIIAKLNKECDGCKDNKVWVCMFCSQNDYKDCSFEFSSELCRHKFKTKVSTQKNVKEEPTKAVNRAVENYWKLVDLTNRVLDKNEKLLDKVYDKQNNTI